MDIFGLKWSDWGGYRTFSRHPMEMVGVDLSTLSFHEPESLPLLAFKPFAGRFGEVTEPSFLTIFGPNLPTLGVYGTVF